MTKMQKILKIGCVFAVVVIIAAVFLSVRFICAVRHRASETDVMTSSDGAYAVTVPSVKEPEMSSGGSDERLDKIEKEIILQGKPESKQLRVTVLPNREDELVFGFSADDFVESFNDRYYRKNGRQYILPSSCDNWQTQRVESAIHSTHETLILNYSADRDMWSLPTISVYVPPESDYVQEIILNFDWHSYTDELYDLYEEMCYCTLKGLLPDCPDEQITEVYKAANKSGYDNVFPSDEWYSEDSVPVDLFYQDGIGIYSHFAIGSRQRLCIIPVTEQTLASFEKKGTVIREIGSFAG